MMKHRGHRFFDDDSPQLDRFGPLLALTVLAVVIMSLADLTVQRGRIWPQVGATLVSLAIGGTLVLAMRASGVARRWRLPIDIVVLLGAVVTVLVLIVDLFSSADLSSFASDRPSPLWVGIAILTPPAVIRRLVQHRRVTVHTMLGAIAAYLLIAVAFAYTYNFVDAVVDGEFFAQGEDQPTTAYMYFSLISITTTGFGDLTASHAFGRLLAGAEAVIGQVYLVTFVAILVGLLIQQRQDGLE
jgi:hypothetical protein